MIGMVRGMMRSQKQVAGLPAPIASFRSSGGSPITSLIANVDPVQSGTGDPSPDNVRPITGRTSATVTHTGANVWGGDSLADTIVSLVSNATKDTANKTVTFGAVQASNKVLFTTFKANTRYTIMLSVASGNANMAVNYTDGTSSSLSNGVNVTNASKSVAYIRGQNQGGATVLNYESCGIFEGVLTADDFEPYVGETYTKTFATCYGGKLNLTTGALEVAYELLDVDSLIQSYSTSNHGWMSRVMSECVMDATNPSFIAEQWRAHAWSGRSNGDVVCDNNKRLYFLTEDTQTRPQGNILLELATPQTIQLTPEEVRTFLDNTLYADTGDIVEVKLSELIVTTLFSRG